jgi:nitrite reductase (NO-forming)
VIGPRSGRRLLVVGAVVAALLLGCGAPGPSLSPVTPSPVESAPLAIVTPSPGPSGAPPELPNATPRLSPDPNATIYSPLDARAPAALRGPTHDVELRIDERPTTIAQGIVQNAWKIGSTVPGPVIRVRAGDTVRVHLINHPPKLPGAAAWQHPAVNDYPHAVEFHGATGAWQAQVTPLKPGEETRFEFKAERPGVWMYHGSTEPVLQSIANGMYGMLIVEPKGGLDRVAQEFFLVQGEWYVDRVYPPLPPLPSLARAAAAVPDPDFVTFNGIADQYQEHPIQVATGQRIRVFLLNAGPNLDLSFAVEGATFDRVIREGGEATVGDEGSWGSQAVNLSPGQGAIVELTLREDGLYPFGNHALNLASIGAAGLFQAVGGTP